MVENNYDDADDLIDFLKLTTKRTGLPVEVYVDDGEAYIRNSHDIIVYVRDGYNNNEKVVPVLLSDNPTIDPAFEAQYGGFRNLSESEIQKVFEFIAINEKLFLEKCVGQINHIEFFKKLKKLKA